MREWGFIFCLRFRHHFFSIPNFKIFGFRKKKFLIWILRFHRKMCRLFPCITIFKWFFFIKSAKRMCICDYVKNHIGTCKKCVFWFQKGYKRISVLDSCKTYCLFKPCWLSHVKCTCFKETALLFNVLWICSCDELTNTCSKLTIRKLG